MNVYQTCLPTYALWSEFGLLADSTPLLVVAFLCILMAGRFLRSANDTVVVPLAIELAEMVMVDTCTLAGFRIKIPANAMLFVAILACRMCAFAAVKGRSWNGRWFARVV